MLRCSQHLLVGDDVLGAEDLLQALDDRFSAQFHVAFLCVVGWSGQWKIGNERSRSGSVASRIVW